MLTKTKKSLAALVVACVMTFAGTGTSATSMFVSDNPSFSISASAADFYRGSVSVRTGDRNWLLFSTSTPLKVYAISNSHRIPVYSNANLSSPENNRYIYGDTDEIWVYGIGTNHKGQQYAWASYPTSSGRRNVYIPLSTITNGRRIAFGKCATSRITTYKKPGKAVYGSISAGDTIWVICNSGSYSQVIYPVTNSRNQTVAYKMAYISKSDLDNRAR